MKNLKTKKNYWSPSNKNDTANLALLIVNNIPKNVDLYLIPETFWEGEKGELYCNLLEKAQSQYYDQEVNTNASLALTAVLMMITPRPSTDKAIVKLMKYFLGMNENVKEEWLGILADYLVPSTFDEKKGLTLTPEVRCSGSIHNVYVVNQFVGEE